MPEEKDDQRQRVEIAFESGQTVGALVPKEAADALEEALRSEEPVFQLETEDGTYVLALRKVAYVKRSARETHIGFGMTVT